MQRIFLWALVVLFLKAIPVYAEDPTDQPNLLGRTARITVGGLSLVGAATMGYLTLRVGINAYQGMPVGPLLLPIMGMGTLLSTAVGYRLTVDGIFPRSRSGASGSGSTERNVAAVPVTPPRPPEPPPPAPEPAGQLQPSRAKMSCQEKFAMFVGGSIGAGLGVLAIRDMMKNPERWGLDQKKSQINKRTPTEP